MEGRGEGAGTAEEEEMMGISNDGDVEKVSEDFVICDDNKFCFRELVTMASGEGTELEFKDKHLALETGNLGKSCFKFTLLLFKLLAKLIFLQVLVKQGRHVDWRREALN